jgi:Fibronectin type III domain
MASSNTNSNNLGNGGKMYITIALVSQDKVNNTSTLKVTGELENTNNFVVDDGSGKYCSFSGEQFFDDTWDSHFKANERRTIISHTFVINHGSDGDLTAGWNFHIGNSGTTTFGGNRDVDATLFCPHIDQPASKPGTPSVTALAVDSISLGWSGPTDNGGSSVTDYIFRMYTGSTATGTPVETTGFNRSRAITGLTPGATYTFTVVAVNGSQINSGHSAASNPRVVTLLPGPNIRVAGAWVKGTLWVRDDSDWKQGVAYVRSGGIWKQAI